MQNIERERTVLFAQSPQLWVLCPRLVLFLLWHELDTTEYTLSNKRAKCYKLQQTVNNVRGKRKASTNKVSCSFVYNQQNFANIVLRLIRGIYPNKLQFTAYTTIQQINDAKSAEFKV